MSTYIPSLKAFSRPCACGVSLNELLPKGKTLPEPCFEFVGHPTNHSCLLYCLRDLNHEGCIISMMNSCPRTSEYVVRMCVVFGYLELLKRALYSGFAVGKYIHTYVGRAGCTKLGKYLVDAGFTASEFDYGCAAYTAAGEGHMECMKFYLGYAPIRYYRSALIYAAGNGQLHIVKYLVDLGHYALYALIDATTHGHLECMKYMIDHGSRFEVDHLQRAIDESRDAPAFCINYLIAEQSA